MLKQDNALVVLALPQEIGGRLEDWKCVFTGVGKVNATYGLMDAMMQWYGERNAWPGCVINIGSAGSSAFKAGSLVNPTKFLQHDMDVTPLGFRAGETPYETDCPLVLDNGLRLPEWPEAVCATGDHFVTKGTADQWNVVDMEAYALAKVCWREHVPFACLKYISDGADGRAATTWESALADCAVKLSEVLPRVGKVLLV